MLQVWMPVLHLVDIDISWSETILRYYQTPQMPQARWSQTTNQSQYLFFLFLLPVFLSHECTLGSLYKATPD